MGHFRAKNLLPSLEILGRTLARVHVVWKPLCEPAAWWLVVELNGPCLPHSLKSGACKVALHSEHFLN